MTLTLRHLAAAASVAALAACGGSASDGPAWIHLAHGAEPGKVGDLVSLWAESHGDRLRLRSEEEGAEIWLDYVITKGWERAERPGRWQVTQPGVAEIWQGVEATEMRTAAGPLREISSRDMRLLDPEPEEAFFCRRGAKIVLQLPKDAALPEECFFGLRLERGAAVDGVSRAVVGNLTGDGLPVWPGESVAVECDLPPESTLRFQTAALGLEGRGTVRFRVTLDGEEIFADEVAISPERVDRPHEVRLPPAGRPGARLVFAAEGDPATSAFFNPVIGPTDVGRYGARPWQGGRPDIVLFVADTFRADNLAAYGGEPDWTPNMNALADDSLRFLQARSPAPWTLPAHASLFTGVLPLQHGAILHRLTFPRSMETIAELLADHGYRTGAITDSLLLSRRYEMDQGFQWFDEIDWDVQDLRKTFQRSLDFLRRDDGRPVFLFVHTYRTHSPYRRGIEQWSGPSGDFMVEMSKRLDAGNLSDEEVAAGAQTYRDFYIEGVQQLDEQFGTWLATVDELGLDQGYFILTSDHGEEFHEHGGFHHGGRPYEESIRIPLTLRGPDLEPADVSWGSSLIDIPPTLAELCGLARLDVWVGRSLLSLDVERPHFSHSVKRGQPFLAVVEGDRKLFTSGTVEDFRNGKLDEAYDLRSDPGELRNLMQEDVAWPREWSDALAPLWEVLSIKLGEAGEVDVDSVLNQRLRELGYVE